MPSFPRVADGTSASSRSVPSPTAAWKPIDVQQGFYKDYAAAYTDRFKRLKLNPADFGVGGPPEQAWPELALRFTLSIPGVQTAIIGTTRPENLRANVAVDNKGPLPPEVVQRLCAAFRTADPDHTWTAQT